MTRRADGGPGPGGGSLGAGFLAATLTSVALAGCPGGAPVDPIELPVVLGADAGVYDPSRYEPLLIAGVFRDKAFVPLSDGDPLDIGLLGNGGPSTMPALRIRGVGSPMEIRCDLVTAGGALAAELYYKIKVFPSKEAPEFLEYGYLPMFLKIDMEQLDGQTAQLRCAVEDGDGRTASAEVHVLLTLDNPV